MTLISLQFATYTALVLALYYALPRRPQNVLLLAASYGFYVTWSAWYAGVLAALTAFNFALAPRLRSADGTPHRRRLWLGIGVNLAALGFFKYAGFFADDLGAWLGRVGLRDGSGALDIVLPVGMSFYVVQVISYLVDVARGQASPSHDPVAFALYMAYFPRLLAGPIERARTLLPQLGAARVVDEAALARSTTLIVVGVVRKLVIADTLTQMIPPDIFRQPRAFTSLELAGYLVAYAFALYNDFAGYTSVARGTSGLFGIELSRNFNLPYIARSLSDFWNRWHITLSHWLRDYIYFPTSRALLRRDPRRGNVPNILLPPLLAMLASGMWHGTGWHMLAWGGLHGVYLVGERVLAFWRPARPPAQQPRWRQLAARGVVFGLVVLAWVPFRMELPVALDYWRGLLAFTSGTRPTLRLLVVLIPALWIDWAQARDEVVFLRWPRLVQATLLALAMLLIWLVTQATTAEPFVYQGF